MSWRTLCDRLLGRPDVRKLVLRPDGMFSNVNEVVQQLHLAARGGYCFVIDWSASCYRDPARPGDPWLYYFQPCYPQVQPRRRMPVLPGGEPICCTADNIIIPREIDGRCDSQLLLPRNRAYPGELIARHVRLNAEVQGIVDQFAAEHFAGPVIGLHIRGPGRVDGGAPKLRAKFHQAGGVPLDLYFQAVDAASERLAGSRIFACSDSSVVIEGVLERYGRRVITWGATRSAFGEMHARHPKNEGLSFAPYKLGLDVAVEAHLLARTSFFVHGNSNVCNFILCRNPQLEHHYVYQDVALPPR